MPRLDNDKHEQYARCVAAGNEPFVCYFGVGYPPDRQLAMEFARTPVILDRLRELTSGST